MYGLSALDLIHIWERGQYQHAIERALSMLAAAHSEKTINDFAALSIGERDSRLMTLREQTFGSKFNGFAQCPQCNERMEYSMNMADIYVSGKSSEMVHELSIEDFNMNFRLPDSYDLAAAVICVDSAASGNIILKRCILKVNKNEESISFENIPDDVKMKLVQDMADRDPQAEILLNLTCGLCSHSWQIMFDIVSFFWDEICAYAKRLLLEVHIIAQAYGWKEAYILSMNPTRRQFYLEMIS
jgi:hypothetical protein